PESSHRPIRLAQVDNATEPGSIRQASFTSSCAGMGQQRVLRDHDRLGHAAVAENPEAAMAWFGAPLGVTAAAFRALSAVDGRLDFIGGVGPPTRARSTRLASRPLA